MNTEKNSSISRAVADVLGERTRPQVPSLVLLKPGSVGAPVFMAHGIGDTVSGLARLASHIEVSQPIYGMQAKGLDGILDGTDEPLDRIEDMAAFHVTAIRQLQPRGPYFLVGYSLGGLVTVEMARHLSADGEKIGLLALVDSYPHRKYAPLGSRARVLTRLAKARIAALLRTNPGRHGLKNRGVNASNPLPLDEPTSRALPRVRDYQVRAWNKYRPEPYSGKVKFVKAKVSSFLPDDPEGTWGRLVEKLEIDTVPGNHLEMLTTHAQDVGEVLSRYIREAASGGI
jgi:acetoacetyl-CoA synthetase